MGISHMKRHCHHLSRPSHWPSVVTWCRGTALRGLRSGTTHPDGAGDSGGRAGRWALLPLGLQVWGSDCHVALGLGAPSVPWPAERGKERLGRTYASWQVSCSHHRLIAVTQVRIWRGTATGKQLAPTLRTPTPPGP